MIGINRIAANAPAQTLPPRWSPRASFLFIVGFNLAAWGVIAAVAKLLVR